MHLYKYIIFIISLCISLEISAHGLKFYSTDHPIAQRTSYSVFVHERPVFKDYFDIEFNMALYPTVEIGYITRIKSGDPTKIFNLFFDVRGDDILFRLNQEGKSVLISMPVNRDEMTKDHWFKVKIAFDLKNDEIILEIHNKKMTCEGVSLPDEFRPEIVFGKSDHIIDVPSIAINQLKVGNTKSYVFALNETKGEFVYDQEGRLCGKVDNPIWLINEAYHWHKEACFSSNTEAGANYNINNNEIYYFNRDSIFTYNTKSKEITARAFAERCPVKLSLARSFIDDAHDKLYAYEVYHDPPDDGPTIASLDLTTLTWNVESYQQLSMQLHHHDSYYDPEQNLYTIFGGFGNMYYSNKFYTLNTTDKRWEVLDSLSGDVIYPRYFSTIGYLKNNHCIYVFGGMGNESGEQIVGRRYFYDFYKVDIENKQVQKLWEISDDEINTAPARGMVILNDSCFYTLRYPESVSNSFLKLYRFSVKDGSYQILGDSIPILSDKITTNAHLYYNEHQSRLYVTVQESKDDVSSSLTVYSLSFPPVTLEEYAGIPTGSSRIPTMWILVIITLAVATTIVAVIVKIKHKPENKESVPQTILPTTKTEMISETAQPNSIFLFGDFAVFSKNRRDITYMFTARLKQMFCLILQYSDAEGISSKRLSDLIWPDKSKDKVKNSRGVAINHLRKILNELDGIELVYEKGCFKIVTNSEMYCDYLKCMEIISTNTVNKYRQQFLNIIHRGKFIQFFDDPVFDYFKQDVEYKLENVIQHQIEETFSARNYQTTVSLTEAAFNIDPLNEMALSYNLKSQFILKRENEAITTYQKFITEYKKTTGENYPHPFRNYWR